MKTLLALLLMSSPAWAMMPPKDMDLGNERLTERQVLDTYKGAYPDGFAALRFVRVPFGQAERACIKRGTPGALYGCAVGNTVVYSYDTPKLALSQGRNYDGKMANHVLRHEFAHRFFNWPATHPNARP